MLHILIICLHHDDLVFYFSIELFFFIFFCRLRLSSSRVDAHASQSSFDHLTSQNAHELLNSNCLYSSISAIHRSAGNCRTSTIAVWLIANDFTWFNLLFDDKLWCFLRTLNYYEDTFTGYFEKIVSLPATAYNRSSPATWENSILSPNFQTEWN